MSPIPPAVSSDGAESPAAICTALPLRRRPGRLPAPCPCSVPRHRFTVPTLKIGPVVVVIVVCLLIAGLVALAVIEPRPPLRHFEVPVPNERFAR